MAGYTLKDMWGFKPKVRRSEKTQRDTLRKTNGGVAYDLWGNTIAVLNPKDRSLNVTSAGWRTRTTKDRLNKVLPSGYRVIQSKGEWYLETPSGKRTPFKNGMKVKV